MGAVEKTPIYEFGPFLLIPAERLLLRDGKAVPLTPKAFDLLVYLIEHRGHLVEKQSLMTALWPDTVVEEANLAFNISALRKALAAGRDDAKFIETVPTRGYRFVAPVTVSSDRPGDSNAISLDGGLGRSGGGLSARSIGFAMATMAVLGGVSLFLTRGNSRQQPEEPATREASLIRLTANPADQSVTTARISPDGKHLAYADRTGIQVRRIDGGETHTIADTMGMDVYGWSANSEKVRAGVCRGGTCTVWDVPITGGPRTPTGATWSDDERGDISANGSELMTVTQTGQIAVTRLNGSAPQRVVGAGEFDWVRAAALSADASRVFFTSGSARIESVSMRGGATSLLHTLPKGWTVLSLGPALADGRLLFVAARDTRAGLWVFSPRDQAIWQIDAKETAGKKDAVRLTEWRQEDIEQVSASADGKRIVFLSREQQWDVYVATFDPGTARLDEPTRVTRDDRNDLANAWMPDNATVLFYSSRNGSSDLFTQRLDSDVPSPLVVGPGTQYYPRVTGDGRWVLFYDDAGPNNRVGIKRLPLAGGIPEHVMPDDFDSAIHCAPRGRCVIAELRGNEAVVSSFDPLRGRGTELFRSHWNVPGASLSGDGTQWAFIIPGDSGTPQRIRIVRFESGNVRDIVVRNAGRLSHLDWLPTGEGFFSTETALIGYSLAQRGQRSRLLFIRTNGQARTLWAPENLFVLWAIPSRDGKRVAINAASRRSNAWMVNGF